VVVLYAVLATQLFGLAWPLPRVLRDGDCYVYYANQLGG